MDRIKVSVSRMEADARALKQAIADLEIRVQALETAMLSLSDCWEGPSWETFRMAVTNDAVYMKQLISYLKNYAGRLETAAKQYRYGEQDAAMKVKTIIVL